MGKYTEKTGRRNGRKWLTVLLSLIAAVLAAAVGFGIWIVLNYHMVDTTFYPKDTQTLDLRGQTVKPSHIDKLVRKMPECDIYWDIPFQKGTLSSHAKTVTLTTLSAGDIGLLDYAGQLQTVEAEGCTDYENLALLRQTRPDLTVNYSLAFSCGNYAWDVETLMLNGVSREDISLLKYLPNLKTVVLDSGSYDTQTVKELQTAVHDAGLEFGVLISGKVHPDTEHELQISDITDGEVDLLPFVSGLKTVSLQNPKADPEKVFALSGRLPGVDVAWEVVLCDQVYDPSVTEVDLTEVEVTDLAEVEQKLAYLPDLQQVTFGVCGVGEPEKWGNSRSKLTASPIENEALSAYRDRVREDYKVVWTVRLGPSIALRTDTDNFMPNHFGVGQLPDSYAYNLRYCEEMVCLDVGHMTLTDISFVEFMPNLKYLILAWTEVQYIEPIRNCKNLVFLELDNSCIRDLSPLIDCTALEDLNLGNTFCDVTPILGMTWLKNAYFIDGSLASAYKFSQAVPTARVVTTGNATVGGGWRRLPNYYAMRDCLHAPYMN